MGHWSRMRHKLLSMEVLHQEPRNRHWFGTSPQARDTMDAFVIRNAGSVRPSDGPSPL
jgi:hypothetical protein